MEKFRPEGDQFDPNKHNAMFQVPGTEENKGLVAAVTKVGNLVTKIICRSVSKHIFWVLNCALSLPFSPYLCIIFLVLLTHAMSIY